VLPLIDEHMIADASWRHWIKQLNSGVNPANRIFIPVALDATAFNVPAALRALNFLRPAGLPLPAAWNNSRSAAIEVMVRSLLKQLTESMCRLMLGKREAPVQNAAAPALAHEGQPKITIFLSHAKVDGTEPARRIRNYIYSQTQLAAFYDENDIPFGSAFSRVLKSSLQGSQTAAMIVVRSAAYAGRPWCRRELSLFRRPVPLSAQLALRIEGLPSNELSLLSRPVLLSGNPGRWRLNPTIVVDAVEGGAQTYGIPELGNAPLIRWADEIKDQEEQVVTTLLRDAMLGAFHIAVGRTIQETADSLILNWRPDPTTLLHIPSVRDGNQKLRVFYPGRLSGLELDILEEFFPNLTFWGFETATS
jgi:hypothetical protein